MVFISRCYVDGGLFFDKRLTWGSIGVYVRRGIVGDC